ncbi:MAG: citrate/2-methylcitrate synthase [Oscillospiraceae bacterium]|nr:citrate/2-methylcitrate synthase [Oscillospiraceae bacterium]
MLREDERKRLQEKFQHEAAGVYQLFSKELFKQYSVKRGLRNEDGTGVMAGLTSVGAVIGYYIEDGEKFPTEGHLRYRGYDLTDIVRNCEKEKRFGFEEVAYLLLFGHLPDSKTLEDFSRLIGNLRSLPNGFAEDMILKAPSKNIMNKIARSVLAAYSYDTNPDEISVGNILRQSIELIARLPVMAAYGYQAKSHYHDGNSLYLHAPQPRLSTAENLLYMLRPDNKYTREEAEMLDVLLMIHAEHGGGNNSAFTTRVVSSSDTDTYSAIAAAIGSLKGPKHGGANAKVMSMISNIETNVNDWEDEDEVRAYLAKILRKEAFDGAGLIYGMGHAIYTYSDPRCLLLKERASMLAEKNPKFLKEFNLYQLVEKLTPDVFAKVKHNPKVMCANVDLYSGFVYKMLGIPEEMYTPLFAISRIVGWCAHRLEEVIGCGRIIRPAYKSMLHSKEYIEIEKR